MTPEAQAVADLLLEERRAAREADVDRLLELQPEKEEAFARLRASGVEDTTIDRLARKARENIVLMRHLVHVLRAIITGGADDRYGRSGERVASDVGQRRGAL